MAKILKSTSLVARNQRDLSFFLVSLQLPPCVRFIASILEPHHESATFDNSKELQSFVIELTLYNHNRLSEKLGSGIHFLKS